MSSKYIPKGKKPHQLWIEEHKDEIMNLPQNERVDYVYKNMNEQLNTNMKIQSVYQLLYRNNIIEHKKKNKDNNDSVEIIKPETVVDSLIEDNINSKINEYKKFDTPNFEKHETLKDYLSPAIQFTTEHLIHYIGQSNLIMCCLVPNIENIDDEHKPIVHKLIETLFTLNSEIENLKSLKEEMKNVNLSLCEEVVVKFLKNNEIDMYLSKYDK